MMYIYASMLLYKAGKKINEENVKKVLEAAGIKVEPARIKALVAALEGVDIEKAIEKAAMPVATPVAEKKEEKPKKTKEDEKKEEAKAAAGLGALFG